MLKGSSFSATVPFLLPSTTPAGLARRFSLGGARVLIVDDNAASLAILAKMIRSIGGVPELAASAADALAALEAAETTGKRFPILIIDSRMPNVGGVELVKALRDRSDPTPAILMLTSDELHARASIG